MAQVQFRSDDTTVFSEQYYDGFSGAGVQNSSTTDAPIDSAFTGTSGAFAGVATNVGFATGQLVILIQTRGTNANTAPNFQFNVLTGYTAGAPTFKYPLTMTYTTGAQMIVINRYSTFTFGSSAVLTAKAWDGTVGGVLVRWANNSISGTGKIALKGAGFRGGGNAFAPTTQGEGHTGVGTTSLSANGNGAGGANNTSGNGQSTTNKTAGGTGARGSGSSAGNAAGNAGLTILMMGGGGSHGENTTTGNAGVGSAICILVAPTIDLTNLEIDTDGTVGDAGTGGQNNGHGAGGAGSCLLKGEVITLGSNKAHALGAAGGVGSGANGGSSGDGWIHADYGKSITGTSNPTIDSRLDTSLLRQGGALFYSYI